MSAGQVDVDNPLPVLDRQFDESPARRLSQLHAFHHPPVITATLPPKRPFLAVPVLAVAALLLMVGPDFLTTFRYKAV